MYSASRFFDRDYFELFRVHVYHTGRVRWWVGGIMQTSCNLDGTLFPFDSQSCRITIQSWAYSYKYLELQNRSESIHLEHFIEDGTFTYLSNVSQAER